MKNVKLLTSLFAAGVVLVACSVIPPVEIPRDAVGYEKTSVSVTDPTTVVSLATDLEGDTDAPIPFPNIEPPDLPIAPSTFKSVQGFTGTVTVTGSNLPATLTINSGTLTVTVADDDPDGPAPVTAQVDFGPLTLTRVGNCVAACEYQFNDPQAAAESLVLTLNGKNMTRLIDIITDFGGNTVSLELVINIEEDPDSMEFTIEVVENVIGF